MAHRNNYKNFVQNYDMIRKVLRQYYIVGICSKTAENSKRDYGNRVRRVRNFVDEEFLKSENINKIKYNRFYVENYTKAHNFLYDSYLIKNIDEAELKVYFLILQTLNENETIKNTELIETVLDIIYFKDIITSKKDLRQFIERVKEKMVKLGIIDKSKKSKDTYLSLKKDIFEDFSEEELIEIMNAISFYSNVSIISEPAYSIIDVIKDYLSGERYFEYDFESCFSFKQNFLSKILDDEVISLICESIKENKALKFNYNQKDIEVKAEKITTEYLYGRQYLIAEDLKNNNYSKYRIDKIINCKTGKKYPAKSNKLSKKTKKVLLEIDFYIDEQEKYYLVDRVNKEGCGNLVKLEDNHFLYSIEVEDPLSMLPWIRSFGTIAKIRPSDRHNLDKRLQLEYEEILKNYGVDI